MKKWFIPSLLLLLALFFIISFPVSCKKGKNNPEACNGKTMRRMVKIANDSLAASIITTPDTISVDSIGMLDVPEAKREMPRQPEERQVYTITAKVADDVGTFWDGDLKIKLTNGKEGDEEKFINCEAPNMGCPYIKGSIFFDEMTEARSWIIANEKDLKGKTVTVTGIGFIDIPHKVPKNADNEMELHPILDIHF